MYHDFLILGGAGLVGTQVIRQITRHMAPRRIVVASLFEREARAACEQHAREFGAGISFVPAWGDVFLPTSLAFQPRKEILADPALRRQLLDALFGDLESAYRVNHLAALIAQHRPEVIIDAVNTATGISYQDVFDGATRVREWIKDGRFDPAGTEDLEVFLLSQSTPQLIRHVMILQRATKESGAKVYLKVGTTGTGGMGLNIPYTHSEDRPSKKLLAKTEVAFGHTGLLFLLARTPDAPVVKELKPAAMIGYRAVHVERAKDKHGNSTLFKPREMALEAGASLALHDDAAAYPAAGEIRVAVVDTGENGVFTRGEFGAITALGQMEYITPEEIAWTIVQEIRGVNTGQDIISALDSAVMNPSYKAGLVRGVALRDLDAIERESVRTGQGLPSVALGKLGPPELSKLLFEAALLRHTYGTIEAVAGDARPPSEAAQALAAELTASQIDPLAPSIGIPILLPDGQRLRRGPRINVPEVEGHARSIKLDLTRMESWIQKGWIDLRPANVTRWRERTGKMLRSRADLRDAGSAAATLQSFLTDGFELGEVVAWIFNNEMGGSRVK